MSDYYKKTFRGYLIDHHSPEPPVITFSNLHIEDYEEFYEKGEINNLMLYCKDHWGYSYYNTQIGSKHPALQEDWVAQQVAVLRAKNIEFNAYYCIEYDNTVTKLHPQWAAVNPNGEHLRCTGRNAKWRIPCYMTGYREYALGQLQEIVRWYTPDSLFLDIFGKSLCYCPNCKALFAQKNGFDLPETEEDIATHAASIIHFLDFCAEGFLDDVISSLKAIDPTLAITINFSSHYPKSIRDKLDYHFTEPWAGNWLSAAYARDTGVYPQLGPGDVSHMFDYTKATIYEQAASEIAAQGCRVFLYSEPQLPDGSLEQEEAIRIGKAYKEVKKFEHLLEHRLPIADIAILQSDSSTAIGTDGKVVPNAIARARAYNRHVQSVLGAMKLCNYSKFTWSILPEQEATKERLETYRVILLPQVLTLSDQVLQNLLAFVSNGGIVCATDETALYDNSGKKLDDFSYASDIGISYRAKRSCYAPNVWGGFLSFSQEKLSDWNLPHTTFPITEESIECMTDGNVLGTFVEPAEILGPETWVNWGYPPPKTVTTSPLVVEKKVGKGRWLYTGFDLFALANRNMTWPYSFLRSYFLEHIPCFHIRLETMYPDIVNMSAFWQGSDIIVHLLSSLPARCSGDAPPVDAGKLILSTQIPVYKAFVEYPVKEEIPIVKTPDGSIEIQGPLFTIHQIIRIQGGRG